MRFGYIAIEKGKGWFVPQKFSGIVEVDFSSGKSKFLSRLSGYSIFESNLCGAIQKKNNLLVTSLLYKEELNLYRIKESESVKVILEKFTSRKEVDSKRGKFRMSFCKENYIYFIGCGYPGIIKIDTASEEIKIFDIEIENGSQAKGNDNGILGWSAGITDKKLYIPLCGRRELVVFDMEKEEYKIEKIRNSCYMAVSRNEQELYLFPEQNRVIENYDIDQREWKRQIDFPKGFLGEEESRWYCAAFFHCGYMWIFPSKANMVLRLEVEKEEFVCIEEFDNVEELKYLNAGVYDENKVWGFYQKENRLDIIDCHSLQIQHKYISTPDNIGEFVRMEEDWESYVSQIHIEEELDMKQMLSFIYDKDSLSAEHKIRKGTGSNIWEKIG